MVVLVDEHAFCQILSSVYPDVFSWDLRLSYPSEMANTGLK